MIEWLLAFLSSSSLLYLLLFLPFIFLARFKKYRHRTFVQDLFLLKKAGIQSKIYRITGIIWWLFVAALILTLSLPPIPSTKAIVVRERQTCERDIVYVADVSGSMKGKFSGETKFNLARNALYDFAKGRPQDCFTTIIFSDPSGSSYSLSRHSGALLISQFVQDADELILPLKEGIDDDVPYSQLKQLSQGTIVSGGFALANDFLKGKSIAKSQVIIALSDFQNGDEDNPKVVELINELAQRKVAMYFLGVDTDKSNKLYSHILEFKETGKIYYFEIEDKEGFAAAYKRIDSLEPAPPPRFKTEVVSVKKINHLFLWGALALLTFWAALEWRVTKIP